MTVTNTSEAGHGIYMNNAKVELFDVALKGSQDAGLFIRDSSSETTLVATRCEFANSKYGAVVHGGLTSATFNNCLLHGNAKDGIYAMRATIHLYGQGTAIHSNGACGMRAVVSPTKFLIHLPSNHNTSYNNGDEDRRAVAGGTITNVED